MTKKLNPIHTLAYISLITMGSVWAIQKLTEGDLLGDAMTSIDPRNIKDELGLISVIDLETKVEEIKSQNYPYSLNDEFGLITNPKLRDLIFNNTPSKFDIAFGVDEKEPGLAITLKDSPRLARLGDITNPLEILESLMKEIPSTTIEEHFPAQLIGNGESGDIVATEIWNELMEKGVPVLSRLDALIAFYSDFLYFNVNSERSLDIENELTRLNDLRGRYTSEYFYPLKMELYSRMSPKYLIFDKLAHKEKDINVGDLNDMGLFKCFYWVANIVDNLLALNGRQRMSPVIVGTDGRFYMNDGKNNLVTYTEFVNWFDHVAVDVGWEQMNGIDYDSFLKSLDNRIVVAHRKDGLSGHTFIIRKFQNEDFESCLMQADFDGTVPKGNHFKPISRESFELMNRMGNVSMYSCPII